MANNILHRAFSGVAAATGLIILQGCASPPNNGCVLTKSAYIGPVVFSFDEHDEKCAKQAEKNLQTEIDARRAFMLINKPNDPIANGLGWLAAWQLSPEADKLFKDSMQGKKFDFDPEIVKNLLLANAESNYVAINLYARLPNEKQLIVNDLLRKQKIEPRTVLQFDDAAKAEALNWVKEAAADTSGKPTAIRFDECKKFTTANGTVLSWTCAKPAVPKIQ